MSTEELISQHVIDPEICIRCNTCEDTCPIDAVTHDDTNYVVQVDICDHCMECIAPCPTGAIDNWRTVLKQASYSIEDQFSWDELPDETPPETSGEVADRAGNQPDVSSVTTSEPLGNTRSSIPVNTESNSAPRINATLPPWSAAHAYTNLYGPGSTKPSISAKVTGNFRVTEAGTQYDTHHIVLDFGSMPFPVLEGQSIGIIPPGTDVRGRPHHARQYSVASPRNGERPGYNNVSLTVKRVLEDYDGNPVHGVASNYLCDLEVGDEISVIGPFGASFLMPNHPRSSIVMICTGTGSAPMRAMTEWRRRLAKTGKFEDGDLLLFFGARTPEELPYFGPLQNLPTDFIDINFAFSRVDGQPRRYVQDVMLERGSDLVRMLRDPNAYFYVCGLKAMEAGVLDALKNVSEQAGVDWDSLSAELKSSCRLHLETY